MATVINIRIVYNRRIFNDGNIFCFVNVIAINIMSFNIPVLYKDPVLVGYIISPTYGYINTDAWSLTEPSHNNLQISSS